MAITTVTFRELGDSFARLQDSYFDKLPDFDLCVSVGIIFE